MKQKTLMNYRWTKSSASCGRRYVMTSALEYARVIAHVMTHYKRRNASWRGLCSSMSSAFGETEDIDELSQGAWSICVMWTQILSASALEQHEIAHTPRRIIKYNASWRGLSCSSMSSVFCETEDIDELSQGHEASASCDADTMPSALEQHR